MNISLKIEKTSTVSFTLFDLQGKEMATNVLENNGNGSIQTLLDVSGLSPGIYFLEIKADLYSLIEKVIIN